MTSTFPTSDDTRLPNPIIGGLAEVISNALSHAVIDNMFVSIDTPGYAPVGNKLSKTQEWLKRFDRHHHTKSIPEKLGLILGDLAFRVPRDNEWGKNYWRRIDEILARHDYSFDGDRTVSTASKKDDSPVIKLPTSNSLPSLVQPPDQTLSYSSTSSKPESHAGPASDKIAPPTTGVGRVFVIHGHDRGLKNTVARFLEKLDLEAVILHETADKGSTIMEKLERSTSADFAVALLTPDDEGKSNASGTLNPRARQNVIFEMGIFIGKIGRSHVCAIVDSSVERPSDLDGVVYLPIADWKTGLLRRISEAGLQYSHNKIMSALAIE